MGAARNRGNRRSRRRALGAAGLAPTRAGRVGAWIALAGVGFLGIFAAIALVWVIGTGDVPEIFVLFGVGLLLLIVGHLVLAPGLRGAAALGGAWFLPVVAALGAAVAVATEADPYHDIGLITFEAAWVVMGIVLLAGTRRSGRDATR